MKSPDLNQIFFGHYKQLIRHLEITPGVLGVFLFGSQMDGYASPQSDIDLAVLMDHEMSLKEELDFSSSIQQVVKNKPVDILFLNKAGLILRHRACSGFVLYERDPDLVSDFIEKTVLQYIDYLPDLKSYYRDYDQALEEAYEL